MALVEARIDMEHSWFSSGLCSGMAGKWSEVLGGGVGVTAYYTTIICALTGHFALFLTITVSTLSACLPL